MKKIAIIIPFHKETLNDHEEKSLQCLLKKTDKENIFLILPKKFKENFNYQNIKKFILMISILKVKKLIINYFYLLIFF